MAGPRVVDPSRFALLASVIDWTTTYRRHLRDAVPPQEIAKRRGLSTTRTVALRWVQAPELGYPTEPFMVWRRRAEPAQVEAPVGFTQAWIIGQPVIVLDQVRVFVRVTVNGPGGLVLAFAGIPWASGALTPVTIPSGTATFSISGAAVASLVLPPGTTITSLSGLDGSTAMDLDWEPIEIVGLPDDGTFAGVYDLDAPQGFVAAPGDPIVAALDRFRRGAPFYGWEASFSGHVAPPWVLADPKAMLRVMSESMLAPLRDMIVTLPAEQHHTYKVTHSLAPPSGGQPAVATFFPLATLDFAAATDPLASLVAGFGTNLEDVAADRAALVGTARSAYDYMVTAAYQNGTAGSPGPLEYAAFAFAPGPAPLPPTPANLAATSEGLRSPSVPDGDWSSVSRIAWDAQPSVTPFRVGSYALARAGLGPAAVPVAVMDPRPYDAAVQPIAASTSPAGAAAGRLAALDDRYQLAATPDPNSLLYAVAQQDLFAQWSPWGTAGLAVGEPPVQHAALISARLDAAPAPPGSLVAGTLTIDLGWDWATRTPAAIDVVGRVYTQAKYADPPGNLSVPSGLATSLTSGAGVPLRIAFGADGIASILGATAGLSASVGYLSFDGKTIEAYPPTPAGPRRYRLTITGFTLDFDSAGYIGTAIWARGQEARAPGRVGPWSVTPLVASSADPRPPLVVIDHEDVLLASVADAADEHHVHLAWPPAGSAVGYYVYATTESKLRLDRGLPDAPLSLTLAERLVALRDAFAADPSRRSFTRVNATPVTTTSLDHVLPRGTKEIHLFIVLGVSAGQVESAWPKLGDPGLRKRFAAYAAPQLVVPAPPDLEVTRATDPLASPVSYRASLRIRTHPGATVARVDIHRVRVPEAAIAVDTMGPPVARVSGTAGAYTVTANVSLQVGESQAIGTVSGLDDVAGSWKPVFYRAVAWSADDATRGLYGARSAASSVRSIIVPPPGPPDLAPLASSFTGTPGALLISTTTTAPVEPTDLGPHRLDAEVLAEHADGQLESLYRYPEASIPVDRDAANLERVPTAAPVAGVIGVYRDAAAAGSTPIHVVAIRDDAADQIRVRIRLTDPLGRMTEQTMTVPAGQPVVPPDITNPRTLFLAGRGTLMLFETSVPDEIPGVGAYSLAISLRRPLPPPSRRTVAVGQIRVTFPGDNIFNDPAVLPVRQAKGPIAATRTIGIAFRQAGVARVDLRAPDGTTATFSRTVP